MMVLEFRYNYQLHYDKNNVEIYSRNGINFTKKS